MSPGRADTPGLILFAHGARDARWAAPFEATLARIQAQRSDAAVVLAFLEFMAPTLPEAAAGLVARGCTRVEVLPLFLGTGGHLRRDLPLLIDGLRSAHPRTRFELHTAAGETDTVIDALARVALGHLDRAAATR
jgi:sirohydrochlorin cobaltochelatase